MINIQYAAGFFDGEGCIHLNKLHSDRKFGYRYCFMVSISNTFRPILEKFQERWGGTIVELGKYRNDRWRPLGCWKLCGTDAEKFLAELKPHLIEKEPQACVALAFRHQRKRLPTQLHKVARNEIQRLDDYVAQCKYLKRVETFERNNPNWGL